MEHDHSKIAGLISIVSTGTQNYLQTTHGIACSNPALLDGDFDALAPIKGITAIVGMGGPISMLVAVSFEQELLNHLFVRETEGLDIPEAERDTYVREMAAEIVNIILGNCTADLEESVKDGQNKTKISMSPPVVILDVDRIHRSQSAAFTSVSLKTMFGRFAISIVGPRELISE